MTRKGFKEIQSELDYGEYNVLSGMGEGNSMTEKKIKKKIMMFLGLSNLVWLILHAFPLFTTIV